MPSGVGGQVWYNDGAVVVVGAPPIALAATMHRMRWLGAGRRDVGQWVLRLRRGRVAAGVRLRLVAMMLAEGTGLILREEDCRALRRGLLQVWFRECEASRRVLVGDGWNDGELRLWVMGR